MTALQARDLRPGQWVRWTLFPYPPARVVDLTPWNPFPSTVRRGRLVRIAWNGLNAEYPATDCVAWTDDLLLVDGEPTGNLTPRLLVYP